MAETLKKAERELAKRSRRHARQRAEQHQRACARARETLLSSGWEIRPRGSGGGLVIERESFNRDGSSASPHRLYLRDELDLLKKTLRPKEQEPRTP